MRFIWSGIALGALTCQVAMAAPAAGAESDEVVRQLVERLEAQEKRIAELEASATVGVPAAASPAVTAPAAGPKVETKGGLKVESADGKHSFSLGGRIQADVAQYGNDRNAEGDKLFGDGTAFRRVRLDAKGKVYEDWAYRVQYDFLDSGSAGLKDAYIMFERYDPWYLQMGQFFQPFGLERQTSSNNITFLERSMSTNALTPDRHMGIKIGGGGVLGDGTFGEAVPFWTVGVGVFGMRAQDDNASAGSDESRDVTGRVTIAPIYDGTRLLQVGASYRLHDPNDASVFTRFRDRPEAYVSQVRLVDTGDLSGGTGLVDNFSQAGLELAGLWGPFAAQGEWMKTEVDRRGILSDPSFTGGYAQVSWLLTGETRGFKPSEAVHDKVKPFRPYGKDGWGAWEVGVRYSTIDLTDAGVIGGQEDNLTLGVNWYPTENLRFMANFVKVLDLQRAGNATDGVEPEIFQLRGQVTW